VLTALKADDKFDYVEENIRSIVGFNVVGLYKAGGTDFRILVVK
jgi:hypothetical protein